MHEPGKTEVHFRNPANYIKELIEVPQARRVVWDRGYLMKRAIDPYGHGNIYFGKNPEWRAVAVGPQGAAEVNFEHGMDDPLAVYPVWVYGEDDLDDLEFMIANPIGESRLACTRGNAGPDETPVYGQPHKVFLTNLPDGKMNTTKSLLRNIRELQEDYLDTTPCVLHIHGLYSFRLMFSLGFGATDVDPRTHAAKGKIILPPGKIIPAERAHTVQHWLKVLEMTPSEMKVPRNRCIYNIKSALWAGEYFNQDVKFQTVGKVNLDPYAQGSTNLVARPAKPGVRTIMGNVKPKLGDMELCDTCSLQDHCKLYRKGAVCSVPGSELSPLASVFKTRDSDSIIDGLSTVLAAQAQRVERGIEQEEDFGEIDPEVTKMMNQLFQNGVKFAKLVNPNLTKPLVQINGSFGSPKANTKQITAQVVKSIMEETGLPIEDITAEMVGNKLAEMAREGEPKKAITQ